MSEEQINLNKEKVSKEDQFIVKYEGPSFENRMELHSFAKQASSVEKILKEAIAQLSSSKKIKDKIGEQKFYLKLNPGSFETNFLVLFTNPIILNLISDFIFEYLKYIVTGRIEGPKYNKELKNFVKIKKIRSSTKDIISPCIQDSDRVTFINGDQTNNYNLYVINKPEREGMKENLLKIEKEIPIEEFEQNIFGRILKVDAIKSKEDLKDSKLWFVAEEEGSKPIEIAFRKEISEEEIREILFNRLLVKAIIHYKGDEKIKIEIIDHSLSPTKKLDTYT